MKPLILAHRGYSEIAPENTKLAFDSAQIFEFDGLEINLHMTKDEEVVVIRDEDVKRTSNGTGRIHDDTLEEVKKLNFASKFGQGYPHQSIMTYKEFLKCYGNSFKVLNVDIKTDIIHYQGIEKLIWAVNQEVKHKAEIIYSSFNFESLIILNKISQKANLGYLFVDEKDCQGKEATIKEICSYIHPWFKSMLNKESLSFYQKLNLPINLWTFDKRETGDEWTAGSNSVFEKISKLPKVYAIIANSKY